jgi:hypothetical protein
MDKNYLSFILLLLFFGTIIRIEAQENFYAFYTKINSGEIFEKYSRTGPYADIVVQTVKGRLIFHRSSSYLPYWQTEKGKLYIEEIVPRDGDGDDIMPDKVNAFSYVRIISQNKDEIVIHWRYQPKFAVAPNPYHHTGVDVTKVVDEYFFIRPNGEIKRTIRKGTKRIDDWQNDKSLTVQTINLDESGIVDVVTTKTINNNECESVKGNPVKVSNKLNPVAHWSFNEGVGVSTSEVVSGKYCPVHGHKALWKDGISGTALQFDGYSSIVTLPSYNAPKLDNALTIEAWIAVGAYPWNWTPIIKQDEDNGFFLGINSYGQPGFKIRTHEEWYTLTGDIKLEAFRWYHLAGTFNASEGEMKLYIDGKLIALEETDKSGFDQSFIDVQIGKGLKREATDVVRSESDVPADYGFDGLIDEIKIYDYALSESDIKSSYEFMKPESGIISSPDMQKRYFPETQDETSFGGRYIKLNYYETWDNLWRVSEHSDLVVDFDMMPGQFVFWRGASYIPHMVSEDGIWFSHEFNEIWATEALQCMEPLADVKTNYSHVRMIENSPARVIVHWRFALNDVLQGIGGYDPGTGWGEYSDWYYTIYPDGIASVKMVLWSNLGPFRGSKAGHREWQESIALIPPGKKPEDIYEIYNTMSVSDLDGNVVNYDWGPEFDVTGKKIQVINTKSDYNPFLVGDFLRGNCYYDELTEYSIFPCWNHWPAAVVANDGRNMLDATRAGHSSTTQITMETAEDHSGADAPYVVQYKLEGLSSKSADSLTTLAKSWLNNPEITGIEGAGGVVYNKGERAFIVNPSNDEIRFTLEGSSESPVYNPAIVIKDRNSKMHITINGETPVSRQGLVRNTRGELQLVIWIELESNESVNILLKND